MPDIHTVRRSVANVSRNFDILQPDGEFLPWQTDTSWNPYADLEKRVGEVADAALNTNCHTPTVFATPQPKRRKKTVNFGNESKKEKVPANIWAKVKGEEEMKKKLERMLNLTVTFVAKETAGG